MDLAVHFLGSVEVDQCGGSIKSHVAPALRCEFDLGQAAGGSRFVLACEQFDERLNSWVMGDHHDAIIVGVDAMQQANE